MKQFIYTLVGSLACIGAFPNSYSGQSPASLPPSIKIEITQMPSDPPGEALAKTPVTGSVSGAPAGSVVVIYAQGGARYYVQPYANNHVVRISKGRFSSRAHGGDSFIVCVVAPDYVADETREDVPAVGGKVLAVKVGTPK